MSCITEILKIKDDKEILDCERGVVIEDGGEYKGYEYLVIFDHMGFRCGYVAVPPTHPLYNYNNEDYSYFDLEVHGGVTFWDESHLAEDILGHKCLDKWIGFDCGHAGDAFDYETAKKYFANNEIILKNIIGTENIRKQVEEDMERQYPGYKAFKYSDENKRRDMPRPKEYVISQCESLIDQLIKIENEDSYKEWLK